MLTSITPAPLLEAMPLPRNTPDQSWDRTGVAQRLYVIEKAAGELLSDLCAAGLLAVTGPQVSLYLYQPRSDELRKMIDRLAEAYNKNLVEVTNLLRSMGGLREEAPAYDLIRLVAYGLLLLAILEKNGSAVKVNKQGASYMEKAHDYLTDSRKSPLAGRLRWFGEDFPQLPGLQSPDELMI